MRIDTSKVRAARKVLVALQKMLAPMSQGNHRLSLDHYQNCREQGFIVINYHAHGGKDFQTRWVAFAENRNSDDVVVYPGEGFCPFQGITEESYKNAEYFSFNAINQAAAFCVNHLLK